MLTAFFYVPAWSITAAMDSAAEARTVHKAQLMQTFIVSEENDSASESGRKNLRCAISVKKLRVMNVNERVMAKTPAAYGKARRGIAAVIFKNPPSAQPHESEKDSACRKSMNTGTG